MINVYLLYLNHFPLLNTPELPVLFLEPTLQKWLAFDSPIVDTQLTTITETTSIPHFTIELITPQENGEQIHQHKSSVSESESFMNKIFENIKLFHLKKKKIFRLLQKKNNKYTFSNSKWNVAYLRKKQV